MNLFQRIVGFLTRPAAPGVTAPPLPSTQPEVEKPADEAGASTSKPYSDMYIRGATNGALLLPHEHYETFVRHARQSDRVEVDLTATRMRAQQLEARIAQAQNQHEILISRLHQIGHQLQAAEMRHAYDQRHLSEHLTQRDTVQQDRVDTVPSHAWPAVLFYLAVGLIFLAADLTVTHSIVIWGLDLTDWSAWIFAAGLAALTFGIKPAFDRLFENPYAEGNRRKNHWLLAIVALLVITCMGLFGYYRADAEAAHKQKRALQKEVVALEEEAELGGLSGPELDQLNKLVEQQKALEDAQAHNPIKMLALVMAAVLFALCGAIAFGIGLPALDKLWRRQIVLPRRHSYQHRRVLRYEKQLCQQAQQMGQLRSQLEIDRHALAQLPDPKVLTEELRALLDTESEQILTLMTERIGAQLAEYRDGYLLGYKYPEKYQDDLLPRLTRAYAQKGDRRPYQHRYRPYKHLRRLIMKTYQPPAVEQGEN